MYWSMSRTGHDQLHAGRTWSASNDLARRPTGNFPQHQQPPGQHMHHMVLPGKEPTQVALQAIPSKPVGDALTLRPYIAALSNCCYTNQTNMRYLQKCQIPESHTVPGRSVFSWSCSCLLRSCFTAPPHPVSCVHAAFSLAVLLTCVHASN